MLRSVVFNDGPPDVVLTLAGAMGTSTLAEIAQTLRGDPRYRTGVTMLIDCTGVIAPALTDDGMRRAVEPIVERDWEHPPRAIAVVAPDPATRKFVTLANAYMGGSLVNRRVFTNIADARSWLRSFARSSRPLA